MELAAGTGWWTEKLVKYADHITAVDSSSETLAICKAKVGAQKVSFIKDDIFSFKPDKLYDLVFFSFWLSHVPPDKFNSFWQLVSNSLKKNGRVFFIDSLKHETPKPKSNSQKPEDITSLRNLKSGKEFKIIKIFYQPQKLSQKLQKLGWQVKVKSTPNFFIYGFGRKLNEDNSSNTSLGSLRITDRLSKSRS